jgi:hypothetical protein
LDFRKFVILQINSDLKGLKEKISKKSNITHPKVEAFQK